MDFNLVQAYLKKLPKIEELMECYEVKTIINKYSDSVVKEFLEKLIDKRHKEIVTAEQEENLKKLDFSLDYYIDKLKKSLATEKGKPLKKVINCLGTVFSEHIGSRFYPKEVVEKFNTVFSGYSNLELDEESGAKVTLDEEINKFFNPLIRDKDFVIVNSVGSALFLIISILFKDKKVITGLSDSFCFNNDIGIQDIVKEARAKLSRVGYINKIDIQDYLKEIETKEELIIYSSLFENSLQDVPKLKDKDILSLKEIVPILFITNKVYINSYSKDIKSLGLSLQDIINKNFPINLLDFSVLSNCPDVGVIIGEKEYIEKLKNSFMYKAFIPGKETKSLLYFVLKMYMENKDREIFINKAFSRNYDDIKEVNRKFIRKIEREIGEKVDVDLVKGNYLNLGEKFPKEFSFEREVVAIKPKVKDMSVVEKQLRLADPSILCWLSPEGLLFSMQLVSEEDEEFILDFLKEIL